MEHQTTAVAVSNKHPCFDKEAKGKYARVHLPVAPQCNIQCNYCNRKYDCVNESRPGVTSSVLAPYQVNGYLKALEKHIDNISVIGIAGPGDPFANPDEVLGTMRAVKAEFPDKIFCLSTNGLNLEPYIDEIAELGVSHVTITMNAVDPAITASVYKWVRFNKKIYRGIEGAKLLLERQLACIPKLKAHGITVKINSIIIPGVNDTHIQEVARVTKALGADIMNCIPLLPTKDTAYEHLTQPDHKMAFRVRCEAGKHIAMMTHCARCRADAAGLLGQDVKEAYSLLQEAAQTVPGDVSQKPYVAVATNEGLLVNLHLGECDKVSVYKQTDAGFDVVEIRAVPKPGSGDDRWKEMAKILSDCRSILVSGAGPNPERVLKESGLNVVQMTGLIDEGLAGVFNNRPIRSVKKPDAFKCGSSCRGTGMGCG